MRREFESFGCFRYEPLYVENDIIFARFTSSLFFPAAFWKLFLAVIATSVTAAIACLSI